MGPRKRTGVVVEDGERRCLLVRGVARLLADQLALLVFRDVLVLGLFVDNGLRGGLDCLLELPLVLGGDLQSDHINRVNNRGTTIECQGHTREAGPGL